MECNLVGEKKEMGWRKHLQITYMTTFMQNMKKTT